MSTETIVAVYDTAAHAHDAVAALKGAGVPDSAIETHAGTASTDGTAGTGAREGGFWSTMFGGEAGSDTAVYDRSMAGGSTVVTVKAPDEHVARVMQLLESFNPIDIDERASGYGLTQTAPTAAPAAMPVAAPAAAGTGDTLSLSEETLAVGKRVVNQGGTRIRRYVVETPVEQSVSLHSEKVTLERRPVTDARPVSDAAFSEKTIEMTEMAEEAVVSKSAHVYEEVGLRKDATERTETVRDTVRKEEVEVEQIPGKTTTTTTTGNTILPKG